MSEDGGLPVLDVRRLLPWLDGDGWRGRLRRTLERLLGLPRVWKLLENLETRAAGGEAPFEAFLDLSGMRLEGAGVGDAIPPSGPLVVVSNHPFGGADALALATLCKRVRQDTRIMANAELLGIGSIADDLIPLQILGESNFDRRNVGALREGLRHVRNGGLLVLFPAGAVSFWQWGTGRVADPPWSGHAARVILRAGAPVLPVWFFGRNGPFFQLAGVLHPALRTALIPRAFLAMRGKTVRCEAGPLIAPGKRSGSVEVLTSDLRRAVERVSAAGGN